jgi:hypothetical protein
MIKSSFKNFIFIRKLNENLNNSLYIYKNIDELEHFKYVWSKRNLFRRYFQCIYILFKRTLVYFDFKRSNFNNNEVEVLLYVNSENTYNSLKFLKSEKILIFKQVSELRSKLNEKYIIDNIRVPLWLTILSIFNFPLFILKYWKKAFKYPELYFENFGKEYSNQRVLRKFKSLKKVIFANDHNVHNRMFKIACKKSNIKTVYLQHAAITSMFPKLDFDQSFLFGESDFMKYSSIGEVTGEVLLVGSPKFDELQSYRRNLNFEKTHTFGLALNTIDDVRKIKSLVNIALIKTSYNIIIRMHPGDKRKFSFNSERVKIHNANENPLINFFSDIDFLISGESSIHLESLYINIRSVYFNFTYNSPNDYYCFLKEKLISVLDFNKISDDYFIDIILTRSTNKILKKFIHSIGESYDGNVGELIINEIRNNCDA